MKFIQKLAILLATLAATLLPISAPAMVYAQSATKQQICEGIGYTGGTCNDSSGGPSVQSTIKLIVNILSLIVGVIAVIMIIIGGLKYITSGGDANSVSSAKNTILYAIIGLVIVALAQVIVRFVLNKVAPTPGQTAMMPLEALKTIVV